MSKTRLVQERIEKLLGEQNGGPVKFRVTKLDPKNVHIELKTKHAFLQINNLGEVLDNTFYSKAIFSIDEHTTLNIQSLRYEYDIKPAPYCNMHSFCLKKGAVVNIDLEPNCTLVHKGSHRIKSNKNCSITNANRG